MLLCIVWLLGSELGEKIINLTVVGINVENILSASAVPLCNVHHTTATSQENKQSEENCADISAKTLLALGAVHKSLFGCESSPISRNVCTLVC